MNTMPHGLSMAPRTRDSIPKYSAIAWDVPSDASYRVALGRGGTVTERPEVPAAEELMARFAAGKSQKAFWRWQWGIPGREVVSRGLGARGDA